MSSILAMRISIIYNQKKGGGEIGIREMGQSVNYLLCEFEFDPQHASKKPVIVA